VSATKLMALFWKSSQADLIRKPVAVQLRTQQMVQKVLEIHYKDAVSVGLTARSSEARHRR
jgi:hypothetical protein